jgi:polyphosphate kinase
MPDHIRKFYTLPEKVEERKTTEFTLLEEFVKSVELTLVMENKNKADVSKFRFTRNVKSIE